AIKKAKNDPDQMAALGLDPEQLDLAVAGFRMSRKSKKRPKDWEDVARAYSYALAHHLPPTLFVATVFDVARSTAARWVNRCRYEFHLLPPTSQGRAGGHVRRSAGRHMVKQRTASSRRVP